MRADKMIARRVLHHVIVLTTVVALSVGGIPPLEHKNAAANEGERIAVVNPIRVGPTPVITSAAIFGRETSYPFEVTWSGMDPDEPYSADLTIDGPDGPESIGHWTPEGRSDWNRALWEVPPEWPSGIYTLRAVLRRFDPDVFWREVAVDSFEVRLDNDAERTSVSVSPQGMGFFKHQGEALQADVNTQVSIGTARARFFYSTSPYGVIPEWQFCDAPLVDEEGDSAFGFCELQDQDEPNKVRWLASVTNETPAGVEPDPAFDGGSSIVNPRAYRAKPRIFIDHDSLLSEDCVGSSVTVLGGHRGDGLARADVDVHATRTSFVTRDIPSDFGAPDRGSHESVEAPDCFADRRPLMQQGRDDSGSFHVEGPSLTGDPVKTATMMTSNWRLTTWFDFDRDDVKDPGEPHDSLFPGEDLHPSLRTERHRVKRGRKARIYGSFDGTQCSERLVKLKRRVGRRPWKTIDKTVSRFHARYDFEPRVRRRTRFKVVGPAGGRCSRAVSNILWIKIKK